MAGFTVEIRPGQQVVVKAVPAEILLPDFGTCEDQRPAREEFERYLRLESEQIGNLRGGRFEDTTELAIDPATTHLVEILRQFRVSREVVCEWANKFWQDMGMPTRQAKQYSEAFSDFLVSQNLEGDK